MLGSPPTHKGYGRTGPAYAKGYGRTGPPAQRLRTDRPAYANGYGRTGRMQVLLGLLACLDLLPPLVESGAGPENLYGGFMN